VPTVTGESKTQTNSSTWVGIDGDGTTDLAQAGTEQDAFGTGNATVTTYRAWAELLPNQPTESVLTGISINPGDQVFTEVWIGPAGGGPSLTNPFFMIVCMENLTSPGSACFNYTPVGGSIIGGSEAEWIIERPGQCDSNGNNCTLSDLAKQSAQGCVPNSPPS
jgi:Peptidase A4 family